MSQLRQKMIREMDLKNLSDHTKRAYLAAVKGLSKHYCTSPEKITDEQIEDYLLHLKNEKGRAPNSCTVVLTGLRFFYKHVLEQQIEIGFRLSKKPRKLPTVLTRDQDWKIINGPKNIKHRLALMTTYAARLRVGRVIAHERANNPILREAIPALSRPTIRPVRHVSTSGIDASPGVCAMGRIRCCPSTK